MCLPGIPEADGEGLEDTQEAGRAHGHIPAHTVNIENSLHSISLRKYFNPKAATVSGTPLDRTIKVLATVMCL